MDILFSDKTHAILCLFCFRPRTEGKELKDLFYDEFDLRRFQHEHFVHQHCEEDNKKALSK